MPTSDDPRFEAMTAAGGRSQMLETLRKAEDGASHAYAALMKAQEAWAKSGSIDGAEADAADRAREKYEAAAFRVMSLRQEFGTGGPALPSGLGGGEDAASKFAEFARSNPQAFDHPAGGSQRVPSLIDLALSRPVGGFKAAVDGGSLGATRQNAQYWFNIPRRPLSVIDLIPLPEGHRIAGLGGEKVQYFKQSTRTNNAAAVQPLGEKPATVLTYSREEEELYTYAHISEQIPRQLLGVGMDSKLREIIEEDMSMGVLEAFEAACLAGNGSNTVDGLTNVSGTLTQSSSGDPIADIRRALTQLQNANIMPDALVINPSDAETIDLETDAEGMYFMGGPLSEDTRRAWTTPIVVSTGLTAGTAILGNFRIGMVRWEGDALLEWKPLTDDFKYNALRLVAEQAASAAVTRPGAFVKITIA